MPGTERQLFDSWNAGLGHFFTGTPIFPCNPGDLVRLLSRKTLRDSCQFGSWIMRIAGNYCLSLLRRKKCGRQLSAREMTHADRKPGPFEDLERAIAELAPESRQVLVTYYFGSESIKDLAEKRKLSRSAVCQRLRAATQQLHKLLIEQGDVL